MTMFRASTRWWWAVLLAGASSAAGCGAGAPPASTAEVRAMPMRGELPALNPRAKAWRNAPEFLARLLPQDVTEPRLLKPGISLLKVRALHSDQALAFRLEWQDPSHDATSATSRFSDAVAIQLPARPGGDVPSAFMGEAGKAVRIHFWKAAWQESKSEDKVVKALYPNASIDYYPFGPADAKRRPRLEAQYAPARAVGNPVTHMSAQNAVQELEAEGFGTLTAVKNGRSTGFGEWSRGTWSTVIALPFPATGVLKPGARSYVAFAVWDGSSGHVGARKMRSNWVSLVIEAAR